MPRRPARRRPARHGCAALAELARRHRPGARRCSRGSSPAVVVGFGGYPSVPTLLAATQLRLPTVLHEQNAVLGRANRLLARARRRDRHRLRRRSTGCAPAERAARSLTGNPVRAGDRGAARRALSAAGRGRRRSRLLVTGGSQGARVLREVVPAALGAAAGGAARAGCRSTQQCRPEDIDAVRARLCRASASPPSSRPSSTTCRRGWPRAHLVIGRAGASTVAELAAAGRPAILVPLPVRRSTTTRPPMPRALAEAGGALADRRRAQLHRRRARRAARRAARPTPARSPTRRRGAPRARAGRDAAARPRRSRREPRAQTGGTAPPARRTAGARGMRALPARHRHHPFRRHRRHRHERHRRGAAQSRLSRCRAATSPTAPMSQRLRDARHRAS